MHQVKIFKGLESELPLLEKQVNSWLTEAQVKVVNMFGNISPQSPPPPESGAAISKTSYPPSDVLLVVLYETR